MQHRFERAEDWVARFDDPQRDAWQKPDVVIAALQLAADDVVADVGAGTGYFAVRLARAVPNGKVIASDVEPDMVRYLGERARKESLANVIAVQGDAGDPKLPERVGAILIVDVLHHVADRPAFFRALAGALDDGGRIVVVDFKPDAPEEGPGPPRKHRLAIAELERDAKAAGLVLHAKDEASLPYQYVVRFARPTGGMP
ncbi:MAG TPA: class I SAM-dependent methyltransferase [Nannocystaceae bacterium]|nr:class I SAM-dependent methyltransferase [Nannocystaceae bacterium]